MRIYTIYFTITIFLICSLVLWSCSSEKGQGISIGQQFPTLSVQTRSGETKTLSAGFNSKARLISIRTMGCRYCESDFLELEKLKNNVSPNDLEIITISVGFDKKSLDGFIKSRSISFPVLMDEEMKVMQKTNTVILPVAYLVDSENIVLYRIQGALSQEEIIEVLKNK